MTESNRPYDNENDSPRNRRRWLMGAVATAAALAGAGLAWRKYQVPALPPATQAALWELEFAKLDGSRLAMAALRGKPLLLNFWATWCPPCVEELPLLSSFYQQNAVNGWQILGLAVDQLAPVQRFLAQAPVSFPVVLAGSAGLTLGQSLGNVSGGLPFTVVLAADGSVLHRKIGKLTSDELQAWAMLRKSDYQTSGESLTLAASA